MPIIGSISGSFGYGRSPQTSPPPGFSIYPPIGSIKTWAFTTNGAFSFGANTVTTGGNCYVITPTTTFVANVKLWGAGGGGGNSRADSSSAVYGGSGGATYGQIMFQSGQPYTVFTGAAGPAFDTPTFQTKGASGGAATGILLGNIFSTNSSVTPLAIAGGGGGASAYTDVSAQGWQKSGAGGGTLGQLGDAYTTILTRTSTSGAPILSYPGPVQSGLPNWADGYNGGHNLASSYSALGGGGGGNPGGQEESGGSGFVANSESITLTTINGVYAVPALYDDSVRGLSGDSDSGGFMTIFMDEYVATTVVATGGTVTEVPIPGQELSYKYHTFTSDGKFTVTSAGARDTIDIFAVGGGGGGDRLGAGGGGGGVALRTGFSISAGNYIVDVGSGGSTSDAYSLAKVGGVFGGYPGEASAFYTNPLASKYMPDSYWRLINSFGAKIRYISPSGDNTTGLTVATAYTTIESAISKNSTDIDRIVFVVLAGTYEPAIGTNVLQTPINDGNNPRIFVCVPNRVTINFTPADSSGQRDSPMAFLRHPQSAIYGATIVRNMFDASDDISQVAFFNNNANPPGTALKHNGSFYNCAFKENLGKWALVYDPTSSASFRIENCTFLTKDAEQDLSGINSSNADQVLVKSCVFNKAVVTNAVLDNCVTGVTVGAKYVTTGVTDKGVYAGEFGWGSTITVPEKTAKDFVMVAQGGGGGGGFYRGSYGPVARPYAIGGSGGGSSTDSDSLRTPSTQYNVLANLAYSSYGYPGGIGTASYKSGGGGAQYPGLDAYSENSPGGVGLEWPRGSGVYYGTGGDAENAASTIDVAPGTVGHGGTGGTVGNVNGEAGTVIVRYIVPGAYTPLLPAPTNINLIAYGGQFVTTTSTYRQHVFTTSSSFVILNAPEGLYLDVIVVGGGAGGVTIQGGAGGQVIGQRISSVFAAGYKYQVTIGGGGTGKYGHGGTPNVGQATTLAGQGIGTIRANGGTGYSTGNTYNWGESGADGTLYTEGLFSDNTTYYGGAGGNGSRIRGVIGGAGGAGGGGRGGFGTQFSSSSTSGGYGDPNTGGGGGGGGYATSDSDNIGGNGGSGIVIIRYRYFS